MHLSISCPTPEPTPPPPGVVGEYRGFDKSWCQIPHYWGKIGCQIPTMSPPPSRGVPIIGSATISATDMVLFTNIGIGTEQQKDRYRYRYLYSSNSLYINGLCIGFLRYPCGSGHLCSGLLFTLQQAIRYEKPYKYTRF